MNQAIDDLVNSYKPNKEVVDLVSKNQIVLMAGISGAGKDTIKNALIETGRFEDLISHTTRPPRQNNGAIEVDGEDYYFIDIKTAEKMIQNRKFIEVKNVHGTLYGTSLESLKNVLEIRKIPIADVDIQGVAEYRKLSDKIISLFIIPPDYDSWVSRLRNRYPSREEFEKVWEKRRESAIKELTFALEQDYFHWIINAELNETIARVKLVVKNSVVFDSSGARAIARRLLQSIIANN